MLTIISLTVITAKCQKQGLLLPQTQEVEVLTHIFRRLGNLIDWCKQWMQNSSNRKGRNKRNYGGPSEDRQRDTLIASLEERVRCYVAHRIEDAMKHAFLVMNRKVVSELTCTPSQNKLRLREPVYLKIGRGSLVLTPTGTGSEVSILAQGINARLMLSIGLERFERLTQDPSVYSQFLSCFFHKAAELAYPELVSINREIILEWIDSNMKPDESFLREGPGLFDVCASLDDLLRSLSTPRIKLLLGMDDETLISVLIMLAGCKSASEYENVFSQYTFLTQLGFDN